jgi:small-conductance mechanosensitive channel
MAMIDISSLEWFLITINIGLFVFAGEIVDKLTPKLESQQSKQVHLLRVINIVIIGLILYKAIVAPAIEENWLSKALTVLLISYVFFMVFKVYSYFMHSRYGKQHETDSGIRISETYNSRGLVVFGGVFLFIIWLISCIQLLGFESLLQAGGVLGFVGVMLALTQAAWAPDIISGLIILNTKMVEEGDILQINQDGKQIYANVYKTRMLHTEFLDMSNNHRMMIKNSQLRGLFLQNLSKFASAKGLRESLTFNIGYDVSPKTVRSFFAQVENLLREEFDEHYESQHPIEVVIDDTGDHAVKWTVFFYTKDIKQLLKTRQVFREVILNLSIAEGLSLATPLTHVMNNISSKKELV